MARNDNVTGWVGWVYFAGALMLVSGVFQGIMGLTALLNDKVFLVTPDKLAVLDYTQWGWVHLALGVILLTAGMSVINGGTWGRVVGVLLASLSLVANFMFLPAYPLWSIVVLVINVLVMYALLVHGDEAKES